MKKILLFYLVLLLSGCGTYYDVQSSTNSTKLLSSKIGDSRDTLNLKMGPPRKNEQYLSDGKVTEIWFYRCAHTGDGIETDDEFTPVVMVDDKVIGWGRGFYDNSIKIKSDITIKNR